MFGVANVSPPSRLSSVTKTETALSHGVYTCRGYKSLSCLFFFFFHTLVFEKRSFRATESANGPGKNETTQYTPIGKSVYSFTYSFRAYVCRRHPVTVPMTPTIPRLAGELRHAWIASARNNSGAVTRNSANCWLMHRTLRNNTS